MWGHKKLIVARLLGLLLAGGAALVLLSYLGDPLASLLPPEHGLPAERQVLAAQNHRRVEHITLSSLRLGEISFTLSLPDPLPPANSRWFWC